MKSFGVEVWVKYAIAVAIMILRFATRWKMVGWRHFDGTDFWCVVATAMYTIVSTCDYILSTPNYPTNIGLNEETAMQVPDERIPLIARGSKIAHFSWTMYICMIFSFKGVLLSLFRKVGMDIWRQEVLVRCTTVFVLVSWAASVLTHICACLPISRVSQVKPFPGPYCTTRPQNYYVAGILNMITDTMILLIPVPMLWKLQVPLRRKLALSVLFCSGIFIIICTILRTYYSLGNVHDQYTAQLWAGREGFVSMIVVSAPGVWPLLRRLQCIDPSYRQPYSSRGRTPPRSSSAKSRGRHWGFSSHLRTDNTDDLYKLSSRPGTRDGDAFTGSSETHIIGEGASDKEMGLGPTPITVTTEYSVQHEEMPPRSQASMDGGLRSEW